ncbi:MAG: hypothetical protein AAFV72_00115 [Cyanobacteria bacterium J06635_1]
MPSKYKVVWQQRKGTQSQTTRWDMHGSTISQAFSQVAQLEGERQLHIINGNNPYNDYLEVAPYSPQHYED